MSRRHASLSITQSWTERCQPSSWAGVATGRHLGAEQRDVLGGADPQIELDERPAVERGAQLVGAVAEPETTPQHEVGVARHGVRRVVLQHAETLHRSSISPPGRSASSS